MTDPSKRTLAQINADRPSIWLPTSAWAGSLWHCSLVLAGDQVSCSMITDALKRTQQAKE